MTTEIILTEIFSTWTIITYKVIYGVSENSNEEMLLVVECSLCLKENLLLIVLSKFDVVIQLSVL